MPPLHVPLNRRQMLARSVPLLAALSSPVRIPALEPAAGRRIGVTIDDGPATGAGQDLDSFLKISAGLRESFTAEKVPAIMFINERQLHVDGQRDARVGAVREWLDAGLDLGNHTYSHPRLGSLELEEYLDDIIKGEVISRPLLEARRKKLVWFRYPYLDAGRGEKAKAVEDFLARRGYRIAPVSVDYRDYSFAGGYARHLSLGGEEQAHQLFGNMLVALDDSFSRAEARSKEVLGYELPQILLIHCNRMNALTLRTTLQRIRDRGYAFVSLDEAMLDPAYATPGLRPGAMGGGGLLNSLAAAKEGG